MLSAAGFAAAAAAAAAEEQDKDDEEEEQEASFVGAVDGSQRGDGVDGPGCRGSVCAGKQGGAGAEQRPGGRVWVRGGVRREPSKFGGYHVL